MYVTKFDNSLYITIFFLNQARAWFLEIVFVKTSVCVCVCLRIDIIHGTGLETNHVRQLVMYILSGAMRVAVVGNLSIAISICW